MIVIIDRPGQLCNRLWAYTPLIAFCLKYDVQLRVLYFNNYQKYFDNLNSNKNFKIGVFKSYYSYRLAKYAMRFSTNYQLVKFSKKIEFHSETFESYDQLLNKLIDKNKIHFVNAWGQPYDKNLIDEQKAQILEIFRPNTNTIQYVERFFLKNKLSDKVTVGVHIRKKDYKSFLDGRYYFNDSVYLNAMKQLKEKLQNSGIAIIKFLLCSDSPIDLNSFKALDAVTMQESTAINDLYALSKCNYILGPPSTFSMWASFYGNVPIRFVKHKNEQISLSEFSPIIARDRFKNGHTLSL